MQETIEDILTVETPENVAFGYTVAGIGSRFIAAMVDTALIVFLQAIVFGLGLLLANSSFFPAASSMDEVFRSVAWLLGIFGLVAFFFLWGYYIFFDLLWSGQSPGKRLAKVRVIRTDGTPITLTESVIRNLVRLIDFLPVLYGVGVVAMFVDSRARRLGDLAAGTLVVYDSSRKIELDDLAVESSLPTFSPVFLREAGRLPLDKLTREDVDMLDAFYRRRNQFSNQTVVAESLLRRLFQRMETPLPDLTAWEIENLLRHIQDARGGASPH